MGTAAASGSTTSTTAGASPKTDHQNGSLYNQPPLSSTLLEKLRNCYENISPVEGVYCRYHPEGWRRKRHQRLYHGKSGTSEVEEGEDDSSDSEADCSSWDSDGPISLEDMDSITRSLVVELFVSDYFKIDESIFNSLPLSTRIAIQDRACQNLRWEISTEVLHPLAVWKDWLVPSSMDAVVPSIVLQRRWEATIPNITAYCGIRKREYSAIAQSDPSCVVREGTTSISREIFSDTVRSVILELTGTEYNRYALAGSAKRMCSQRCLRG